MQILKCIVTICLVFAFLLTAASHERWKTDPENLVIKACSDSDACRAAPCKPDCNSQENCLVWTTLPDTILSGTWFYYVYVYGAVEMLVKFEDRIKLWNWHSGRCITFEGGWCALAQNVTLKKILLKYLCFFIRLCFCFWQWSSLWQFWAHIHNKLFHYWCQYFISSLHVLWEPLQDKQLDRV